MDISTFKSMLDKYGKDKLLQIIFDNGRVWLINRPKLDDAGYPIKDSNGKIIFYKFDDLVIIDEENDAIVYREHQHGVDRKTRKAIYWDIVNPAECIQGLNFVPADMTPEQEYVLRTQWDHCIV